MSDKALCAWRRRLRKEISDEGNLFEFLQDCPVPDWFELGREACRVYGLMIGETARCVRKFSDIDDLLTGIAAKQDAITYDKVARCLGLNVDDLTLVVEEWIEEERNSPFTYEELQEHLRGAREFHEQLSETQATFASAPTPAGAAPDLRQNAPPFSVVSDPGDIEKPQ